MADKYTPGLQFQDWSSMPSITEKIMAQQGPHKSLLLSALGYGINQLAGGDSEVGNIMQYGKTEAPGVPPPQTQAPTAMGPVAPTAQTTLPPLGQQPNQPQAGQQQTTQPFSFSQFLFR